MQAYMTQPRKRLLTYLHNHADEDLTAAKIAEELPEISVSAVYRNLSALEKDGAVRKVAKNGSREVFYQYRKAEACRDHLHLSCGCEGANNEYTCKICGRTFHMDEAGTQALLDAIARVDGFTVDREDTVLYGICGECQNK